jgi:hypothetical protein
MPAIYTFLSYASLALGCVAFVLALVRLTRIRERVESPLRFVVILWCAFCGCLALGWVAEVFIAFYGASEYEGFAIDGKHGWITGREAIRRSVIAALFLLAPVVLLVPSVRKKTWVTAFVVAVCLALRIE